MNDLEVEWGDCVITRLTNLNQHRTYAGLLEGIPTLAINERLYLKRFREEGAKQILLWAPQNKVEGWPEEFMRSPTAALPAITCTAQFDHFRPARDASLWASYVAVAWFQEEWALPIFPEVLAKIKKLNWRDIAIDFDA